MLNEIHLQFTIKKNMARSIPVIYQQLLAAKQAQNNLNALNSNSQVSIWNLWLWITAVGQNLFEQLCDLFQSNMETLIANAPVFTPQWIAQMCRNFQYSAANPQVLQVTVSDTYPYVIIGYPVVNNALSPVTQAAVVAPPNTNGQIVIKVTGASGPLDGSPGISGPTCTALISYLNLILPPNVEYLLINDLADRLYIQAQVFYNASYSGVIQANMGTAINNYLSGLPFNGIVTVSALEEAMLAVTGVTDVTLQNVFWRKDSQGNSSAPYFGTPPGGGFPPTNSYYTGQMLVSNYKLLTRNYQTYAGYVETEQTAGYTIASSITYFPS